MTFGLGFKPTVPRRPFGPNPGSFGHFGTGGAVGLRRPGGGVAFGYVMNHVIPRWQSTRNRSLIDALYAITLTQRPRTDEFPHVPRAAVFPSGVPPDVSLARAGPCASVGSEINAARASML